MTGEEGFRIDRELEPHAADAIARLRAVNAAQRGQGGPISDRLLYNAVMRASPNGSELLGWQAAEFFFRDVDRWLNFVSFWNRSAA